MPKPTPEQITIPSQIIQLIKSPDLDIVEEPGQWTVRANKWLGKDRFDEVSMLVKEVNGTWIKDGKNSCFVIPKK